MKYNREGHYDGFRNSITFYIARSLLAVEDEVYSPSLKHRVISPIKVSVGEIVVHMNPFGSRSHFYTLI